MRNFKNWLVVVLLFSTAIVIGQTTLTGKIVDETNQPLPGASIVLYGTSSGASTDFDGNFTFETSVSNGTVVFSFVGYESKSLTFTGSTDFGTVALAPSSEALEEIIITATSFAIDRKTPVAVFTMKAEEIETKLGTQEFPEILKSTPGVYATKGTGGYGDGRINLRGFESNNIGVLINGVPVNDMENGRIYWSNWAGLSDVTSAMQVQRGLGASKVAIPSIGGTINIISKSSDAEQGGIITMGMGNDGYLKYGATISTGLMENGVAVTASAARIRGDGYVDGTEFDGVNYFLNITKVFNDQHKLSFTAFGAQQKHGQRYNTLTIAGYRATESGAKRYNKDWGYSNGQVKNISANFYHKPQMSLNHYWTINDDTTLSTAVYASFGGGGGRRSKGNKFLDADYRLGDVDQPINFDKISLENGALGALGSDNVLYNSNNNHKWVGVLSTFKTNLSETLIFSGGVDARFYEGRHWYTIHDLLGGQFYIDTNSADNTYNDALKVGDVFDKDYTSKVVYGGLFGQLEYSKNDLSLFLSTAVSNTTYSKIDVMRYAPTDPNRKSDKADFIGYSVKGGANYNLDDTNNLFANVGYFSKAPFLYGSVFQSDRSTELNKDALNENVFSAELGYGFRSADFRANLNVYRTSWLDKSLVGSIPNPNDTANQLNYNIPGLDALHQGVELDFVYNFSSVISMSGMVSIGDWKWKNDVSGKVYNDSGTELETISVYSKDLKVSDAAQTTFAVGLNFKVMEKSTIFADYNYAGNLYAQFDVLRRDDPDYRIDSWKMPEYGLFDVGLRHGFKIGEFDTTLTGTMNNILDTEYISDARDGGTSSESDATVYYGTGRTFSFGLKMKF